MQENNEKFNDAVNSDKIRLVTEWESNGNNIQFYLKKSKGNNPVDLGIRYRNKKDLMDVEKKLKNKALKDI
jgi:hypothetical protein